MSVLIPEAAAYVESKAIGIAGDPLWHWCCRFSPFLVLVLKLGSLLAAYVEYATADNGPMLKSANRRKPETIPNLRGNIVIWLSYMFAIPAVVLIRYVVRTDTRNRAINNDMGADRNCTAVLVISGASPLSWGGRALRGDGAVRAPERVLHHHRPAR